MPDKREISKLTGDTLLANSGSLFPAAPDPEPFRTWARANVLLAEQSEHDLAALVASVGLETVGLFRNELWRRLYFPYDDIEEGGNEPVTFPADGDFDGTFVFGQTRVSGRTWTLSLPADVAAIGAITDNPAAPTVVLTSGVDFVVADGSVVFAEDPRRRGFSYEVDADGNRTLVCWAHGVRQERYWTHRGFGWLVSRPRRASSEAYQTTVRSVLGHLMRGPSSLALRNGVAAAVGIPLVQGESETVEAVYTAYGRLTIITDARVYDFDEDAVAVVSVGDTVRAGDCMVDTISFFEGRDVADFNLVGALSIERHMVASGPGAPLLFPLVETDTVYQMVAGVAHLSFDIGGDPEDVEAFWEAVRAREQLDPANSVARALRTVAGVAEPLSTEVPATVSPMSFLLEHVLAHNGVIIYVKRPPAASAHLIAGLVRRLTPAGTLALVFVESDQGSLEADLPEEADQDDDTVALIDEPTGSTLTPDGVLLDAFYV